MDALNCCVFVILSLWFVMLLLVLCNFITYWFGLVAYFILALFHDQFHILSNLCGWWIWEWIFIHMGDVCMYTAHDKLLYCQTSNDKLLCRHTAHDKLLCCHTVLEKMLCCHTLPLMGTTLRSISLSYSAMPHFFSEQWIRSAAIIPGASRTRQYTTVCKHVTVLTVRKKVNHINCSKTS